MSNGGLTVHLVMFDIDGTLTLTNEASDASFLDALSDVLAIDDVDTDWSSYGNVTDQGCLEEIVVAHLGRAPTPEEAVHIRERYASLLGARAEADPGLIRPIAGAAEVFAALRADPGVMVSLATGTWHECATIKLHYAGIDHDGIAIATASDSTVREEIMKISERRAHVAAATDFVTRTYVGDALWDVTASRNLSYGFIGVAAGDPGGEAMLSRAGAGMIVTDYLEGRFRELLEVCWAAV